MTIRQNGPGRTREGSAEQVENYVGIPLTDRQRKKLQQLADKVPTESLEELAADALEVGVDLMLERDDSPTAPAGRRRELTIQDQVALLACAFENRDNTSVPSSITVPLNSLHRHVLDGLKKVLPAMTLDDIARIVVTKGIAQVVKENGLDGTKPPSIEVTSCTRWKSGAR